MPEKRVTSSLLDPIFLLFCSSTTQNHVTCRCSPHRMGNWHWKGGLSHLGPGPATALPWGLGPLTLFPSQESRGLDR